MAEKKSVSGSQEKSAADGAGGLQQQPAQQLQTVAQQQPPVPLVAGTGTGSGGGRAVPTSPPRGTAVPTSPLPNGSSNNPQTPTQIAARQQQQPQQQTGTQPPQQQPQSQAAQPAAAAAAAGPPTPSSAAATAATAAQQQQQQQTNEALDALIAELKRDGLKPVSESGVSRQWTILGKIGAGKFATVYQAQMPSGPDGAPGALIAVKKVLILQMLSVKSREKCLKEVKLLQSMNHTNIIRYFDAFINAQDELVIVLEWAQGGDLKKLIKQVAKAKRVFSERQVWKYCMEISGGMAHMHDKRVMHRDLKPANIMLTQDNVVKLGDLGLSRYFNEATLEAFSKVGTPLYMSPEVLLGNGYGFAADIWSLGCVLYELCMLRSPFKPEKGVNLYELFRQIKAGVYEPIPAALNYSSDLKNFIASMLRLEPDKRPTIHQTHQIATMAYQRLAAPQNPAAGPAAAQAKAPAPAGANASSAVSPTKPTVAAPVSSPTPAAGAGAPAGASGSPSGPPQPNGAAASVAIPAVSAIKPSVSPVVMSSEPNAAPGAAGAAAPAPAPAPAATAAAASTAANGTASTPKAAPAAGNSAPAAPARPAAAAAANGGATAPSAAKPAPAQPPVAVPTSPVAARSQSPAPGAVAPVVMGAGRSASPVPGYRPPSSHGRPGSGAAARGGGPAQQQRDGDSASGSTGNAAVAIAAAPPAMPPSPSHARNGSGGGGGNNLLLFDLKSNMNMRGAGGGGAAAPAAAAVGAGPDAVAPVVRPGSGRVQPTPGLPPRPAAAAGSGAAAPAPLVTGGQAAATNGFAPDSPSNGRPVSRSNPAASAGGAGAGAVRPTSQQRGSSRPVFGSNSAQPPAAAASPPLATAQGQAVPTGGSAFAGVGGGRPTSSQQKARPTSGAGTAAAGGGAGFGFAPPLNIRRDSSAQDGDGGVRTPTHGALGTPTHGLRTPTSATTAGAAANAAAMSSRPTGAAAAAGAGAGAAAASSYPYAHALLPNGEAVNPLALMEDVLDGLKILNYESEFVRGGAGPAAANGLSLASAAAGFGFAPAENNTFGPLTRTYFVANTALGGGTQSSERFEYFTRLCVWLIRLNKAQPPLELSPDPAECIRQLVGVLKGVRATEGVVDLSPQTLNALRTGCGGLVCAVLQRLCAGALAAQIGPARLNQRPAYAAAAGVGDGAAAVDELDADDAEVQWEDGAAADADAVPEDIDTAEPEDDPAAAAGAAADAAAAAAAASQPAAHAWLAELERLSAGGRLTVKRGDESGSPWRRHLELLHKHQALLRDTASSEWLQTLSGRVGQTLRKQLERVATVEKRMQSQFAELSAESAAKKHALDRASEELQKTKAVLDEGVSAYEAVSESYRAIHTELTARSSRMTESGPVVQLRQALAQLKTESAALATRMGIVAAVIARKHADAGPAPRAAAGASVAADHDGDDGDDGDGDADE